MTEDNMIKFVVETKEAYSTFVCKVDDLKMICRAFVTALNTYGYTWVTGVELQTQVTQDDDR